MPPSSAAPHGLPGTRHTTGAVAEPGERRGTGVAGPAAGCSGGGACRRLVAVARFSPPRHRRSVTRPTSACLEHGAVPPPLRSASGGFQRPQCGSSRGAGSGMRHLLRRLLGQAHKPVQHLPQRLHPVPAVPPALRLLLRNRPGGAWGGVRARGRGRGCRQRGRFLHAAAHHARARDQRLIP